MRDIHSGHNFEPSIYRPDQFKFLYYQISPDLVDNWRFEGMPAHTYAGVLTHMYTHVYTHVSTPTHTYTGVVWCVITKWRPRVPCGFPGTFGAWHTHQHELAPSPRDPQVCPGPSAPWQGPIKTIMQITHTNTFTQRSSGRYPTTASLPFSDNPRALQHVATNLRALPDFLLNKWRQNGSRISCTKLTKILYINASTINIHNLESSQWFS